VAATIETIETVIYVTRSEAQAPGNRCHHRYDFALSLALPIRLSVTPRIAEDGRITTALDVSITWSPAWRWPCPAAARPNLHHHAERAYDLDRPQRRDHRDRRPGARHHAGKHKRVPLLGSLPSSATFQEFIQGKPEVELIIFITPTLIEP